MKKLIAALAVSIAAIAGVSLVAIPEASARPVPAPKIAVNGQHFWVKTPRCHGNVRVGLYTDNAKRGRLTVKLTPTRFSRQCTTKVWVGWDMMGANQIRIPVTSGPRGGATVTRTYRVGSGPHAFSAGHRGSLSAVSFYVLVP